MTRGKAIGGILIVLMAILAMEVGSISSRKVVSFAGDSITAAWDTRSAFPDFVALNSGVGGNTSAQLLARFNEVLNEAPDVVVLEIGTNDIRRENSAVFHLISNVSNMVYAAHNAGASVIVLGLPYMRGDMAVPQAPDSFIDEVNMLLGFLCPMCGCQFVNAFERVGVNDTLDGLHPNAIGYAKMQKVINEALWTKR